MALAGRIGQNDILGQERAPAAVVTVPLPRAALWVPPDQLRVLEVGLVRTWLDPPGPCEELAAGLTAEEGSGQVLARPASIPPSVTSEAWGVPFLKGT